MYEIHNLHKMMKNNKWKLILKSATVIHKDKDEEVNDDASKEPEKVKEKKQRKRKKGNTDEEEEQPVEDDTEVDEGGKGDETSKTSCK
ncbi:unnamed protein product [Brassica oleracea]